MRKDRSELGRSRIVLLVFLVVIVVAVMAIAVWGTSWTVSQASAPTAKYEPAGYWDGPGAPSGKLLQPRGRLRK